MRTYAMEAAHLALLLDGRRELLSIARSLGTAEAMREAREDLMAEASVYRTPERGKQVALEVIGGVAHIPVVGELTPSADPCGAFALKAETEYGYIRAALAAAEARGDVVAIALDVNSPGGYVDGVDLTAQAIASIRKPVTAYVDGMACSAAYWLASQADRIVALSPASEIGSIGVACEEYDDDEQLARDGIAHRVYTSTDAPDKRPDTKTPEGRAKIVAELDALHAVFVGRVAGGRSVSAEKVSKDFGRGGVLTAEAAQAAGMIDEVRGSRLTRAAIRAEMVAAQAAQARKEDEARRRAEADRVLENAKRSAKVAADAAAERERRAESIRQLSSMGVKVDSGASDAEMIAAVHSFIDSLASSPASKSYRR